MARPLWLRSPRGALFDDPNNGRKEEDPFWSQTFLQVLNEMQFYWKRTPNNWRASEQWFPSRLRPKYKQREKWRVTFKGPRTNKLYSTDSCFFSFCLLVIFPHRQKYNLPRKGNRQSKLLVSFQNNSSSRSFLYCFTKISHFELIRWKFSSESKSKLLKRRMKHEKLSRQNGL